MVGAGDIARCGSRELAGAFATGRLLDTIEGTIFTLGDHAYDFGSEKNFRECYEPTWGRHKARTRPTPGNHDYTTNKGAPSSNTSAKTPGLTGVATTATRSAPGTSFR